MTQRQKPLAREIAWYEEHKDEWLGSHQGEFVVIAGHSVTGFYPSYEEAFKAGVHQCGVETNFLIKQVLEHEPVFVIY